MESVIRATAVYLIVWIVLRISGNRTFSEITAFDFVLLLILSETIQQALVGEDFSLTTACIVLVTMVGIDIASSQLKMRWKSLDLVMEGLPLVILENGRLLETRMRKSMIDEEDILAAARETHGLERLDQIKYAVLERSGGISIIPTKEAS